MRGDRLIHTQLLMAQSIGALADHIAHSTGYVFDPVDELPTTASPGSMMCLKTSSGTHLMFYDGTTWKQIV